MKIVFTLDDLEGTAKKILSTINNKMICFYGEMGVGKTTLIKALAKELGASGIVNSPTFGLVNEYHNKEGELIAYHFDFYRIRNEEEALDLGLEDYLSSKAWVFMEWPEKIDSLLPENTASIFLHFIDKNTRSIDYSGLRN